MDQSFTPEASHHKFLFPDPEPLYSATSSPLSVAGSDTFPSPFRRGRMYSAYAELRDWKLRMKKAGLDPSTPLPIQVKRTAPPVADRSLPELSMACRNDKRKAQPPPEEAQRVEVSTNGFIRTGSTSSSKVEDQRDDDEFILARNVSSYQGTKELSRMMAARNEVEARGSKAGSKGIFGKTITGLRRSTAKATGWMG